MPSRKAADLLLKSMFRPNGRGVTSSFMFSPVGVDSWERRLGEKLYYDELKLLDAVLFVRKNGPLYFRQTPPGKIRSLLMDFVVEHYSLVADEAYFGGFKHSYAEHVSIHTRNDFVSALADSEIFTPTISLTLFPLDVLVVDCPFDSDKFFLSSCEDICAGRVEFRFSLSQVDPRSFPSILDSMPNKTKPKSWLGIWSPSIDAANRMKNAVLGSLALTLNCRNRYMFTGRKMTQGNYTLGKGVSYSHSPPATPPVGDDIHLDCEDIDWLTQLASKLNDRSKATRREIRALEYFYGAWFLGESDRYPALYMSLESVFGDANRATQAVIDAVRELIGTHVPEARIRALSTLRAAVVHGGSPQVFDSSEYAKYYHKYRDDPVRDLGILAAECLKRRVFGDQMKEKADPNEEIIRQAVESGKIPPLDDSSILDG
ncbi:MAG: hypothetical protein R8K50_04235 [Mariprofundus sp.]